MLDREELLEAYMKADKKEKRKILLRLYIFDEEHERNTAYKKKAEPGGHGVA